jgi:hypothetical protein
MAMEQKSLLGRAWGVAGRNSVIALWLWTTVLLFTSIMAAPVFFIARQDFGRSLSAAGLGRFSFLWFGDEVFKYQGLAPAAAAWLVVPAGLFLILSVFMDGGVFGRLAAGGKKPAFAEFVADCGGYFGRFFRIFLLAVPLYAVGFGGLMKLISAALAAWTGRATGEWAVIIASHLKLLIGLLLLSAVQMAIDYTRIRVVAGKERRILRAAAWTATFLGRRFFRAWGLYLAGTALAVAAGAVCLGVTYLLPNSGPAGFLPGFILSQAFIGARIWVRLFINASEIQLVERSGLS